MIRFASPAWLSMFALEAKGDADLCDGVHIRMLTSPLLGLPLAPWLIWQVPVSTIAIEPPRDKKLFKMPIAVEPPDSERDTIRYVAAEAVAPSDKLSIALVNPDGGRLLTERSSRPNIVGGPIVRRLRLEGDTANASIKVYAIYSKTLEGLLEREKPVAQLALPIPDDCRWYFGGITQQEGLDRVARGAPVRYTPLDRPLGPFNALSPDDEVARIDAQRDEVDVALELVLRDPAEAPWDVTLQVNQPSLGGEPSQYADVQQLESVLLPSCDPGFARYLGFADNIGKTIRPDIAKPLIGLVGVGIFAVDPDRVISERRFGPFKLIERLKDRLPPIEPDEQQLVDRVLDLNGAKDVADRLRAKGYQIRGFAAASGAVPPPDPIAAPDVTLASSRWITSQNGVSVSFRQGFHLSTQPIAPLLAMARDSGQGFEPTTRTVQTRTLTRRVPLLIGEAEDGSGIASDAPVPAGQQSRYRFQVGDLFGRYGVAADVNVPEPERPDPPVPVLRTAILRTPFDDQSAGAMSSGSLDVRVPVPGNDSIGIGGRPIAQLMLAFAGNNRMIAATPGTMITEVFSLPTLFPQQPGAWPITGRFIDDSGRWSAEAHVTVEVTDSRRPRPTPAGPGIIWTSRPGPSPDVELRLSWPATPGQSYRAWLADQRGLGLAAAATRAAVALEGFTQQQNGQLNGLADRFRLLTDEPIVASGDGRAHLATTLPRALQTVCFLRVVPENGGVQADFDSCGVVPVAVPGDLRPPIPRLTATVNEAGQPELTVEGVGFDMAAIAAMEPGLFSQPPSSAKSPQYRLRRASGAVNDPLYARFVADVKPLTLDRSGGAARFVATFEDTSSLLPFVRYTWWAEVRLPPERRLRVGATMLPPSGAITAENAAQTEDAPSPFSLMSAPATLVQAPAGKPSALNPASINGTIEASGGGFRLRLSIADTPVAHPRAVGFFYIRIWVQQGSTAPVLAGELKTNNSTFLWDGPITSGDPTNVSLTVVDPLGRESLTMTKTIEA